MTDPLFPLLFFVEHLENLVPQLESRDFPALVAERCAMEWGWAWRHASALGDEELVTRVEAVDLEPMLERHVSANRLMGELMAIVQQLMIESLDETDDWGERFATLLEVDELLCRAVALHMHGHDLPPALLVQCMSVGRRARRGLSDFALAGLDGRLAQIAGERALAEDWFGQFLWAPLTTPDFDSFAAGKLLRKVKTFSQDGGMS